MRSASFASFLAPLLLTALPIVAQSTWQAVTPSAANANLAFVSAVTTWDADGSGPGGSVPVIGAGFTMPGGPIQQRVAAWDPVMQSWAPLGTVVDASVLCLLALPDGSLYAGGAFTTASGASVNGIARWTGTAWQPLGSGVWLQAFGAPGRVRALASMPNGDLIAGGQFDQAGGSAASNIARWNGSSWAAMAAGSVTDVSALAVDGTGALIANGQYGALGSVAAWNGASWSALGGGFFFGGEDLVLDASGRLVVTTQSLVFRLDPSGWTNLNWVPGALIARKLAALPNGDLLLQSTTGFGANFNDVVQRWNGSAWSLLGSTNITTSISAMVPELSGEVLVAGSFSTILLPVSGSVAAPRLVRYGSTQPALATSLGGGCVSSGGSNLLTATSLPWIGGTMVTHGSGLPVPAFAMVARGAVPASLPLSVLFTVGQPGCNLLLLPITVDVLVTTAGTATASLAVPNVPTLVGAQLLEQWILLEINPSLQIVSATGSNLLQLTLGAL